MWDTLFAFGAHGQALLVSHRLALGLLDQGLEAGVLGEGDELVGALERGAGRLVSHCSSRPPSPRPSAAARQQATSTPTRTGTLARLRVRGSSPRGRPRRWGPGASASRGSAQAAAAPAGA